MCFYKKENLFSIFPINEPKIIVNKNNKGYDNKLNQIISVLIIDDDIIYKKIIKNFLKNKGCFVICVNNGQEGLESVKSINFDLIMCDVHMPIMDGIEFYRLLNELKIVPVVFILYSDYDIINYNKDTDTDLDIYINKRFTPKEIENIMINNNLVKTNTIS